MPCGEYFTSQSARMSLVRWRIEYVTVLLSIPLVLIPPFLLSAQHLSTLTGVYIIAIAVLGLNVMLGYTGEIVLAQGAFMAIGAYTTSQLLGTGIGLLPAVIGGGIVTSIVALVFALPSAWIKGFYIAITTLALQFISDWFFNTSQFEHIHGGAQQIMPTESGLIGDSIVVGGSVSSYYLMFFSLLFFALISANLSRTAMGRAMRAVRENDIAAAVLGVNVYIIKLTAYSLGGFMVGTAGGLYAFHLGFVDPGFFTIHVTINQYVMLLFGGIGSVWGAMLGTGLVTVLEEILRDNIPSLVAIIPGLELSTGSIRLVLFGVIVIIVLAVEPKGVISILGKLKEYLRNWPYAY